MKASKLKDKSVEELNTELIKLLREQLNLRTQKSTGQLSQAHLLKNVRREIARVKTILNQKVNRNERDPYFTG